MEHLVNNPPPLITEHTQKRGVCFRVDKPCFTLQAPVNKTHKSYDKLRLNYYKNRIVSISKTAQSPDLNMSLDEIRTGVTRSERVKATLFVYLLGVLALFGIFLR